MSQIVFIFDLLLSCFSHCFCVLSLGLYGWRPVLQWRLVCRRIYEKFPKDSRNIWIQRDPRQGWKISK